jgi:hypothetical protein
MKHSKSTGLSITQYFLFFNSYKQCPYSVLSYFHYHLLSFKLALTLFSVIGNFLAKFGEKNFWTSLRFQFGKGSFAFFDILQMEGNDNIDDGVQYG